jgi:D-alanyl-D-alanine carboxypeptidase (penicillin-binding protein 5/6)
MEIIRLGGFDVKRFTIILTLLLLISAFTNNNYAKADENNELSLETESVILIEENSGTILYEKGANQKMYPASLTKVATAIYALEKGKLEDIVTVSKNAREADGTRVYLEEGEQVTLEKLIQGLLINSGNDAGIAIAEHLDGSVENFAASINQFLIEKVGVTDTNFMNPHGLFDSEHYTNASDLSLITKYALKNQTFKEIIGTKELQWKGASWDTTLYNHHKLLREMPYEGIVGGKTGFVDESGHTLVTIAEREGLSLIAVTLKSQSQTIAYRDTVELLDFGFKHFESSQLPVGSQIFDNQGQGYRLLEPLTYTFSKGLNTKVKVNDEKQVVIDDGTSIRSLSAKIEKINTGKAGDKVMAIAETNGEIGKVNGKVGGSFYYLKYLIISLFIIKCINTRKRANLNTMN